MFNEDMILSSRADGTQTSGPGSQDRLGYLFLNVLLALVLSAATGVLVTIGLRAAGFETWQVLVEALRSGVFTAVLMAHPWTARGAARPLKTQAAYGVAGLTLGFALQLFVITPYAATGASIFAYMLILILVLPVWIFGKTLNRMVEPVSRSWLFVRISGLLRKKDP